MRIDNNIMVNENKNKQPGYHKKVQAAKLQFASTLDQVGKSIDKLRTAQGDASPDQVSEIITTELIPTLEGVKDTLVAVEDALPTEEGAEPASEELTGINADDNQVPEGNDEEEEKRIASLIESHPKFKSLYTENINMKKAKLASRWSGVFPPAMRSAMEKEFMDEHKDDEDLDTMEAKVASVEKTINAYKTAGLINKTRAPVQMTAKEEAGKKLHTAKNDGATVPWQMRV